MFYYYLTNTDTIIPLRKLQHIRAAITPTLQVHLNLQLNRYDIRKCISVGDSATPMHSVNFIHGRRKRDFFQYYHAVPFSLMVSSQLRWKASYIYLWRNKVFIPSQGCAYIILPQLYKATVNNNLQNVHNLSKYHMQSLGKRIFFETLSLLPNWVSSVMEKED